MHDTFGADADVRFADTIVVEAVEVRAVRLPLLAPFVTSFGRLTSRLALLTRVDANGITGWGEVVAFEAPMFSAETDVTARHVIREFLAPSLVGRPVGSLADIAAAFAPVRGHPMAKAGLELACVDLAARAARVSVASLIGGTRPRVAVGVSLGIEARIERLLEIVAAHLAEGYQRIKLKIRPGQDHSVIAAVRRAHPDIVLSVDANSAYTLRDRALLQSFDEFGLLMIEQPLEPDDLLDHAVLQGALTTPLCLDESITTPRQAAAAIRLGSCRIINLKVGRVGGYSAALAIEAGASAHAVPLWCGGMLESGIGRAHNLALASLPGLTLPGDISASARYFTRDIVSPPLTIATDGTAAVPDGPGIGVDVDVDYILRHTEAVERVTEAGAPHVLST